MSVVPTSARQSDESMALWLTDSANSGSLDHLMAATKKEFVTAKVQKLLESLSADDRQAIVNKIK